MSEDSKLLTSKTQSCNLQLNSVGNIKLCGYLKKKRNKVGGWRKMWFVLQDKLLLSYASKEEYDNKLVSFKDVLNLIPGTVVRPLSGYRFTIETTSNALYTFHCEDRYAYREWITTLLDSLSAKELRFKEQVHQQRVFNSYSMENLPNTPKNFILPPMTHSFECIAHAAKQINSYNDENCVRLPIVYKTAKILERNGGAGAQLKHNNNIKKHKKKQQQHDEENKVHLPATIAVDCCLQLCCNNNNNNNNNRNNNSNKIVYHNNNNNNSNKQINNNNSNMHDKKQITTQKLQNSKVNAVITKNGLKQQQQQQHQSIDSYYKTCKACSKIQQENSSVCPKRYSSSEETETLSSHIDVAAETTSCLLGTSCSLEYMQEKLQKCSLENVPKEGRGKLKSAGSLTSLAQENTKTKTIEPIYAVVDLKNKYAHRQQQKAKQQEQETHMRRCNSYDSVLAAIESQEEYSHKKSASYHDPNDIEAIYEDGELLLFSNPNNKTEMLNSLPCADCELENIYEPIDVRSAPRKTLWRYITQLKVTPFLHLKNSMGSSSKQNMAHYESIEILKNKSSTTTKHLSSLRHKFGTHRRSMQLRMRKLFKQTKKPQNTTTTTTTNHNNNNSCESCHVGKSIKNHHHQNKKPKSKYRLKINKSKSDKTNFVPQKRFFGSLKHLRKPKVH